MTDVGYVDLSCSDPPLTLTARLGQERPNVEAGYGGWQEVARPRRAPLTVWSGSPALRLTLPLLFDDWQGQGSIEGELAQLDQLALPGAGDGAPPRVRISAPGGAVPFTDRLWVIDTLAYGDPALMNKAGDRVRQAVTLGLLEYVADVRVAEDSAAVIERLKVAAAATKEGASKKRVTSGAKAKPAVAPVVRTVETGFGTGEDLLSVAARELGDARRWTEIAQANGIRDPRSISRGQVVRLP